MKNMLHTQVISAKSEKISADSLITSLHSGYLIIPLMENNQKIDLLQKWANDNSIDEKTRSDINEKLEKEKEILSDFNQALIKHFTNDFTFCKILFINSNYLTGFDKTQPNFINPVSGNIDPSLKIEGEDYFFLRYFKSTGIATHPEDVRAFFIADRDFNILERPFPTSPNRQTSFRLRFLDLLNLSLNTNETIEILVTKLNDNLDRYLKR